MVLKELWEKTKEFKNRILGKTGGIMCSSLASSIHTSGLINIHMHILNERYLKSA